MLDFRFWARVFGGGPSTRRTPKKPVKRKEQWEIKFDAIMKNYNVFRARQSIIEDCLVDLWQFQFSEREGLLSNNKNLFVPMPCFATRGSTEVCGNLVFVLATDVCVREGDIYTIVPVYCEAGKPNGDEDYFGNGHEYHCVDNPNPVSLFCDDWSEVPNPNQIQFRFLHGRRRINKLAQYVEKSADVAQTFERHHGGKHPYVKPRKAISNKLKDMVDSGGSIEHIDKVICELDSWRIQTIYENRKFWESQEKKDNWPQLYNDSWIGKQAEYHYNKAMDQAADEQRRKMEVERRRRARMERRSRGEEERFDPLDPLGDGMPVDCGESVFYHHYNSDVPPPDQRAIDQSSELYRREIGGYNQCIPNDDDFDDYFSDVPPPDDDDLY
jgi:hypothetical protein